MPAQTTAFAIDQTGADDRHWGASRMLALSGREVTSANKPVITAGGRATQTGHLSISLEFGHHVGGRQAVLVLPAPRKLSCAKWQVKASWRQ